MKSTKYPQFEIPDDSDELTKARFGLFVRMIEHFNLDNRAVTLGGLCAYSHSVKGGCAIGRELDANLAETLEGGVNRESIFNKLPQDLQSMGKTFLNLIQGLHDHPDYWNHNGLSSTGLERATMIFDFIKP